MKGKKKIIPKTDNENRIPTFIFNQQYDTPLCSAVNIGQLSAYGERFDSEGVSQLLPLSRGPKEVRASQPNKVTPSEVSEITGFHFAVTTLVGFISNSSGYTASKHVPLWELLWYLIIVDMSITEMSLSLMLNSVGFFHVCIF
ncbi:hypothetical protein Tco_1335330 [Tanacetum coccineum]